MKSDQKEQILSYLEQQRAEKLAEMGGYLRHLRLEQALSLEEVAARTKVQPRLLIAIEDGNLEPLPEPIYIKGFIQRYADVLGLNGVEFASVFPTAQGFQSKKPSWRNWHSAQLKPIHLYLTYTFLIVCAVAGLSHLVNRSATPVSSVAGEKSTPAKSPAVKSPPKSDGVEIASNASATNLGQPTGGPVQVDVTVKEESWIRVKADGKTQFEGILQKGTQRSWVAKEELVVRAGNAGGVVLALNKGEAKELGELGKVKEVSFKAN